MPREFFDIRDFRVSRMNEAREADLRSFASVVSSGLLPGDHEVRVAGMDPTTGNASVIVSQNAPPQSGYFVQRALEHLQNIQQPMGLDPTQPVEYHPDPHIQETSSGGVAVHLQQHYKALPIFDAAHTVSFMPDGAVQRAAGRAESVADDVAISPTLAADEAVRRAAEFLAEPDEAATDEFGQPRPAITLDVSDLRPRVIAQFSESPTRATVLESPPFEGPVNAGLVWFKHGDDLRLAWEMTLTLPGTGSQFRTLVDAGDGEVLYSKELTWSLSGRANVYLLDGSAQRAMVDFPVSWEAHGLPVPPSLAGTTPPDWVHDTSETQGNGVRAHLEDSGPTFTGLLDAGRAALNPPDPGGQDQRIVNAFFYCCLMRDFFYLLGFREQDGNFQTDNFGLGGLAGDPVDARVYHGPVDMTASMLTLHDGSSPILRLGLVTSTGRHTALDATVVYHEFTHGVTNRLVGGALNSRALEAPQSRGMGEGWSDYFACTITKQPVIAAWVTNLPKGIRRFPYDESFPVDSENFESLGSGRRSGTYEIGQIWCASLLALNREIGETLTMQLVVDALKLAPANPHFLHMRDAIIDALDAKLAARQLSQAQRDTAFAGMWKVFARFGMGPNATSNGASLAGIHADFTVPEGLQPPATPQILDVQIMSAARSALVIHLQFADDEARERFRTAFDTWLADRQQQANLTPSQAQGERSGFSGLS